MRRFVLTLGLAAILGSSAPSSVVLAAGQAPMADATSVRSYKNKKVDAQVLEIGRVVRGEDDVLVLVQTTKPDMQCSMKVKFRDGAVAAPPRVTSDADGICRLHFDVPARGNVVGPALVKVDVLNRRGDVRARLVQDFAIFDKYRW